MQPALTAFPGMPLRFITCGSVDDGKSTLIGRLLHDCGAVPDDQLIQLQRDSATQGSAGDGTLDLSLLVDGLAAEREQGITIDVAYRYFSSGRRKFIIADTPGHEQYTRNMATAASTADLAVLLVDARKGLLPQTRRHAGIAALMGIRQVILAVNKMDAVGWDRDVFMAIEADFQAFAAPLGFQSITAVPLSAMRGDNVTRPSPDLDWYDGPTLLTLLEACPAALGEGDRPLRLPVQWVNRPHQDFRGFAGTIAAGRVMPGDPVMVLPSRRQSRVARIVTMDGDLPVAQAGQAITLVLSEEVDVSRGDMIVTPLAPPALADQLAAHVIWMDDRPLVPHRAYLLRLGTATVGAQVVELVHRLDIHDWQPKPAERLGLNDIGYCRLMLDRPLALEPHRLSRTLGSFILIDRASNATLACGMVDTTLRQSGDVPWQAMKVDKAARVANRPHQPCVLWFTGLSGAGKSTIADLVEQELHRRGCQTMSLDGDNLRHGLCRDLGFGDADRAENIRRVAEVARLMTDAGLIVLVSLISPFREDRAQARALLPTGEFAEIFVDTPLPECERRDRKGLYRRARSGEIANFTGVDSPYEPPLAPDLHLRFGEGEPPEQAARIVAWLMARGVLEG
jgi:bifunctional enzyme CysN/CysC